MKYVLDVHTHTLMSGHAYSTIREMTKAAKEQGLELLGITEHAPSMPKAPHIYYFDNLKILDRSAYELPVLFGVELNILDENGQVDLPDYLLAELDIVIASMHMPCIAPMGMAENTNAFIKVMQNPHIDIIGHPDDGRYPVDYDEIAKAAKETNTLLEVNNSSLAPTSFRINAVENYLQMLHACEKYGTEVVLNSDAHVDLQVAGHGYSQAIIEKANFPEELIVNTCVEKLTRRL